MDDGIVVVAMALFIASRGSRVLSCVLGLAAVVGWGCKPDRGRCLRSHDEKRHRAGWVQMVPIGVKPIHMIPVRHPPREWTETVCDQWEFPNGKP